MRKLLIVSIVAVLIPAAVFAGPFGLSLGMNTGYKEELGELVDDIKANDMTNIENFDNYQLGPELRLRLWFLELDINALLNSNGNTNGEPYEKYDYQIYGNLGVSFNLFKILGIGLGFGTDMFYHPGDLPLIGYGTIGDPARNALMAQMEGDDLKKMALTAPLNIRANVDFNIGPVTLGVEGVLPTNLCVAALSDTDVWKEAYEGALADWGHTKVSIFLGYNFF